MGEMGRFEGQDFTKVELYQGKSFESLWVCLQCPYISVLLLPTWTLLNLVDSDESDDSVDSLRGVITVARLLPTSGSSRGLRLP